MGGVAGHLNHLIDDVELTFKDIKEIFSSIASGKIICSEKLDGINIFLSFRNNSALYARNKSDLLKGGLTLSDLESKEFKSGESTKSIFIQALSSFEKSIQTLSQEEIQLLFSNETLFYNCEILSKEFQNVLKYDTNCISIHSSGHLQIIPQTRDIIQYNPNLTTKEILNSTIDRLSSFSVDYKLCLTPTINIKPFRDKTVTNLLIKIDNICFRYGLRENSTIQDMIFKGLEKHLNNTYPHFSKELKSNLILNTLKLQSLPKNLDLDIKKQITEFKSTSKQVLFSILLPLELVVQEFATKIINTLVSSVYIADIMKESERIKQELKKTINIINQSQDSKLLFKLQNQLLKLKRFEQDNLSVEGLVFHYNNKVYKLTGNFAPINQILGLLRYNKQNSRNSIDSLEKSSQKSIAIIPGGFKPPHKGHYSLVKQISEKVDSVLVLVSPLERELSSETHNLKITSDMSMKIWNIFVQTDSNIHIQLAKENPIKELYDYVLTLAPQTELYLLSSKKDRDTRFSNIQDWISKHNLDIKVNFVISPVLENNVSSTVVRNIILSNDKESFFELMPLHISLEDKQLIWNIVSKNLFEHQEKKNYLFPITIYKG